MYYLVLTLKALIKMATIWGTCAIGFFSILAAITFFIGSKTWLKDLLMGKKIHKDKRNIEIINIELKEVA